MHHRNGPPTLRRLPGKPARCTVCHPGLPGKRCVFLASQAGAPPRVSHRGSPPHCPDPLPGALEWCTTQMDLEPLTSGWREGGLSGAPPKWPPDPPAFAHSRGLPGKPGKRTRNSLASHADKPSTTRPSGRRSRRGRLAVHALPGRPSPAVAGCPVPAAVRRPADQPGVGRCVPGQPRVVRALLTGGQAERESHRGWPRRAVAPLQHPRSVRRRLPRPLAAAAGPGLGQPAAAGAGRGDGRHGRRGGKGRLAVRPRAARPERQPVPAGRAVRRPAACRRPQGARAGELADADQRDDRVHGRASGLASGVRLADSRRQPERGARAGLGCLAISPLRCLALRMPADLLGPDYDPDRPQVREALGNVVLGLRDGLRHLRQRTTPGGSAGRHRGAPLPLRADDHRDDPSLPQLLPRLTRHRCGPHRAGDRGSGVRPRLLRRSGADSARNDEAVAPALDRRAARAERGGRPDAGRALHPVGHPGGRVRARRVGARGQDLRRHARPDGCGRRLPGRVFALYDVIFNLVFVAAAALGACHPHQRQVLRVARRCVSLGYAGAAVGYAVLPGRLSVAPAT